MPTTPSDWVTRFGGLVPAGGRVLDVACGNGRHLRWFLDRGHPVVGVDRDLDGVSDLEHPALELRELDLETSPAPSLGAAGFSGVVVTNYLHRPLFPALLGALAPGGVLIYETFAVGNERLGRPRNPDFLLREGELPAVVGERLEIIEYSMARRDSPGPAIVQGICARRPE